MPRDGSGNYTLPAGYQATSGQTATAAQHNDPLEDIETVLNENQPITKGGTGASSAAAARTNLNVPSLTDSNTFTGKNDMSSGSLLLPDLVTKTGNYTAVATDSGKIIRFTSDATLSLTAAATLGAGWESTVWADGADVTIDPDGSETVNGVTTLFIPDGSWARVRCTGSAFYAVSKIADVDQHYINADTSGAGDIASSRYTQGVVVGKGWTNTGGAFSPPCVGKFRIEFFAYIDSTTGVPSVTVNESTDGGSNYSGICAVVGEAGTRSSGFAARIVDVTDTSQYRIKATTSWTSGILKGSATSALSGFVFTYLGPT